VLVQTNFGGVLRIDGAPVGEALRQHYLQAELTDSAASASENADGSCMIIVATDAPVDAAGLERLALRAFMGMARTGAAGSNGSGDYVIAFSTSPGLREGVEGRREPRVERLATEELSPLFLAAIEAAEEAIYNSLFRAESVAGARGVVEALPIVPTLEILDRHRLRSPR
jgi:D-aminopeptidase